MHLDELSKSTKIFPKILILLGFPNASLKEVDVPKHPVI